MSLFKVTDEAIAKLPKWAQHHIESLDKNVKRTEKQLTEITSVTSSSDSISWSTGIEFERFLPEHTSVKFGLGGNNYNWIRVRKDTKFGETVIRLESDNTLIIQPCASNVIIIKNKSD